MPLFRLKSAPENEVSNINTPGTIVIPRKRTEMQNDPIPSTNAERTLSLTGKNIVEK